MDNFMEVIEQLAKKIHLSSNCFKSNVQVSEKKVIKSKISTLEGSFLISLLYNFSVWPQSQAKPKSQASFVLFQIDSNKFSRLILSLRAKWPLNGFQAWLWTHLPSPKVNNSFCTYWKFNYRSIGYQSS